MDRNFLLRRAETYLHQIEQLIQEFNYIRDQLAERINKYRDNQNPLTRVDLLSSLAYIEKYTLPLILSQQGQQPVI